MPPRLLVALVSTVSIIAFMALGEVALRVLEPPSDDSFYVSSSNGPRVRNVPNWHGVYCGKRVAINAMAYRGEEAPARRPGDLRITVYGDSHTFGIGAADDETYPAVLEKLLQRRRGRAVNVLNLGVPGYEWSDAMAWFSETFPLYVPNMVILTYNYGDVMSSDIVLEAGGATGVGLGRSAEPDSTAVTEYGIWVDRAKALKATL